MEAADQQTVTIERYMRDALFDSIKNHVDKADDSSWWNGTQFRFAFLELEFRALGTRFAQQKSPLTNNLSNFSCSKRPRSNRLYLKRKPFILQCNIWKPGDAEFGCQTWNSSTISCVHQLGTRRKVIEALADHQVEGGARDRSAS